MQLGAVAFHGGSIRVANAAGCRRLSWWLHPSDGLSREGLGDVDYGHLATVAHVPHWGAPALYPERAMTAVL